MVSRTPCSDSRASRPGRKHPDPIIIIVRKMVLRPLSCDTFVIATVDARCPRQSLSTSATPTDIVIEAGRSTPSGSRD